MTRAASGVLKSIRSHLVTVLSITAFAGFALAAQESVPRSVRTPLQGHPGKVFVAGESVEVAVPAASGKWRVTDYDGKAVAEVEGGTRAKLGRLPIGFYRMTEAGTSNWISAAVIAPLRAPTPATSPVCLDVAMAWFYPTNKMAAVANLCALAGVNRVRDRLNWAEMEPERSHFAAANRYDASAHAQADAGLESLQVIHLSPPWANPDGKRFPLDLRDAYAFFKEMARRWTGSVRAFEPWNEADIPMFGGHTGAEMASLQKAAFLGLKAGNPNVTGCLNVFALHRRGQLDDLNDNEAWAYFDTFNLHHYESFDNYPKLYADFRAVSAGKPLWVTECSAPVKWAGDEKLKEPTDADLKVQSERVAKTFAASIHEGSVATFYFLLPHYVEGQTQFGIIRPDLTPRPAYVALAAVGRLLADAKPIGRLATTNESLRAFAFAAKPDGAARDVLVVWAKDGSTQLTLARKPRAVFDHLGRSRPAAKALDVTTAPLFLVFGKGETKRLKLLPPPTLAALKSGVVSPIVLQALWPADKTDLERSAYRVDAAETVTIPVFAYNFGTAVVRGRISITAPASWAVSAPEEVELAPNERKEIRVAVKADPAASEPGRIQFRARFDKAPPAVLSIRVVPERREGAPSDKPGAP